MHSLAFRQKLGQKLSIPVLLRQDGHQWCFLQFGLQYTSPICDRPRGPSKTNTASCIISEFWQNYLEMPTPPPHLTPPPRPQMWFVLYGHVCARAVQSALMIYPLGCSLRAVVLFRSLTKRRHFLTRSQYFSHKSEYVLPARQIDRDAGISCCDA